MEIKILSSLGSVEINGRVIPPYPKLIHLTKFEEEMEAQLKINGYNVRIARINKDWIAILRGGLIDKKTNELLRENFSEKLNKFFQENQNKVLCVEVIGRNTMATYKGEKNIDFFVFDVMDLDREEGKRFLSPIEVEKICKKYNFQFIPRLGKFRDKRELEQELLKVDPVFERTKNNNIIPKYEGVVLKSLDGNKIIKYKWEDNEELFKDKIPPKKEQKVESKAATIVGHFFQGYGEPELSLNEGISPSEMKEYEKKIESLSRVEIKEIGKKVEEITDWVMDLLKTKGSFDPQTLDEIRKEIKRKIGKEVSKILRRR